jgi:hypothetical protein
VENEMGIALMAVNLRKYTANKDQLTKNNLSLSHFFLFKKIGAGLYSPTPNIIEPK